MTQALSEINFLHVSLIAIVGFLIGGVWYSPALFSRSWMTELKLTPEDYQRSGGRAARMLGALLLTFVSTLVLAILIVDHHSLGFRHGAMLGALLGVGIVAVRQASSALFELRSARYFLIVAGQDVIALTVQGALLTHWH